MKAREGRISLIGANGSRPSDQRERVLKLMALQVAGHLPSTPEDAHRVLELAARIVDGFLMPGAQMEMV